ncbi:MAG TPA: hypothetical protein VF212_17975 [Longimicrobiales bacterium]
MNSYFVKRRTLDSPCTCSSRRRGIPRDADDAWPDVAWPDVAERRHSEWWSARIARQKETDASIAAKADFENLFDRPYEDRRTVRVVGPFTVEWHSLHRVLGVDEDDELWVRLISRFPGDDSESGRPAII